MKLAALAAVALALPAWSAEQTQRFDVAGLRAGMSQPAAKAAGLTDCHIGAGLTESPEAVYCTATRLTPLAGLEVRKVLAEFKGPRHTTLTELRVSLGASVNQAKAAFGKAWGAPTEGEDHLYWETGATQVALWKSPRPTQTAAVTITFDADRGRRNQKAAADAKAAAAKSAAALKAFK